MKNFYEWIQLREGRVIDPNVWSQEMFEPPFKPPLQTTSLDQVPPNYLKYNHTFITAEQHAQSAREAIDKWFMNNFRPTDGEKFYQAKALDDQSIRSKIIGLPYLEKHKVYKGNKEKINIEEFNKIFKYSEQLKQIQTDDGQTAYDEFMMANRLLSRLLDEYKKSGYGHAVRVQ